MSPWKDSKLKDFVRLEGWVGKHLHETRLVGWFIESIHEKWIRWWSSKSSWWNWSKLKLAVLTTCYTMKQDLGVLTLMAFLYFDPGSSPSCVYGSKLNLQNGPTAKNMFNVCQACGSTFGILIFWAIVMCVPWWVSRFSHLPTSQVLAPSSPEGAREKKGRPILVLLFKDGRREFPQLHGIGWNKRAQKKTKVRCGNIIFRRFFWQHYIPPWLVTPKYGWQLDDATSKVHPELWICLEKREFPMQPQLFWMVREWGHVFLSWWKNDSTCNHHHFWNW